MMSKEPADIWAEYQRAVSFNESIALYDRVEKNENFFIGKQWEGVNAPELDKPVFNILRRVINYFIAMLVADEVGVNLNLINRLNHGMTKILLDAAAEQVRQIMELGKFGMLSRQMLRNAAVDGDAALHLYFDPDEPTGWEEMRGTVKMEIVENTAIFFGNPQVCEIERQPYLLIEYRLPLGEVRERMKRAGRCSAEREQVRPDAAVRSGLAAERLEDDKVTVIRKYWKEGGRVCHMEIAQGVIVRPEVRTELARYPIAYLTWEPVKRCYHGVGAVDGLIPNQMAINKMAAMAQRFIRQQAFPRVFYNADKLDRWIEGVRPLAVHGDPSDIVYTDRHNASMSDQVSEYMQTFISQTRDLMGASDAALGNIRPDNTSAIVAVQKSTAVPLELVKLQYYQMVEDFVRIALDMMRVHYGRRMVLAKDEAGSWQEIPVDFSFLGEVTLNVKVDIGKTSYWDELSGIQTMSNLYEMGLVDPELYIDSIPAHLLPKKAELLESLRAKQKMQEKTESMQAAQTGIAPEQLGGTSALAETQGTQTAGVSG